VGRECNCEIVMLNTAINTRPYCDLLILLELTFPNGLNSHSDAAETSVLDPDPDWIRTRLGRGSGSGLRIRIRI
jgi:hypothetical protein